MHPEPPGDLHPVLGFFINPSLIGSHIKFPGRYVNHHQRNAIKQNNPVIRQSYIRRSGNPVINPDQKNQHKS